MIPFEEIIIRLVLGAVIGGIIGFERELHGRSAGFRTQILVCIAAVLIMIVSENYYYHIHNIDDALRIDPARISAGALIGIGFLGSGVIIKSGFAVRGLTTAASIWIVSAIGLAIGGGLYLEGILTASLTVLTLIVLRLLERRIKTVGYKRVIISTPSGRDVEETLGSVFAGHDIRIHSTNYEKNHASNDITYDFTVSTRDNESVSRLFHELKSLDFIRSLRIVG
ncbi:MAG: MgtC/SapB family protein [Nitrospiraceae bacterium]|nr:MAG: MgtC/SapB family protein [Nitrospiraceae bacterium]